MMSEEGAEALAVGGEGAAEETAAAASAPDKETAPPAQPATPLPEAMSPLTPLPATPLTPLPATPLTPLPATPLTPLPAAPLTPLPASPKASSTSKIDVLLKPAGNAPILKKKKWTVDRHKQIGWICDFIRKFIRTETEDSVFVYVNQSFSPSPDTEIGTLFDCFGSDGKLVIYYCRTQAWG